MTPGLTAFILIGGFLWIIAIVCLCVFIRGGTKETEE